MLLALLARHYAFSADNDTQWVHTIARVPKVCVHWGEGGDTMQHAAVHCSAALSLRGVDLVHCCSGVAVGRCHMGTETDQVCISAGVAHGLVLPSAACLLLLPLLRECVHPLPPLHVPEWASACGQAPHTLP